MTKESAIQTIWDYMHMGHKLEKADIIFALGSFDTRVADRAAELWIQGWAPYVVFSGSGTVHSDNPVWKDFIGSTEAEVFAEIAVRAGVPKEVICTENQSQNTGQNYEFTTKLLNDRGIEFSRVIAVQKPYMERRTFATGKVWWPDKEIITTSPQLTLTEYSEGHDEYWLHVMVGDL